MKLISNDLIKLFLDLHLGGLKEKREKIGSHDNQNCKKRRRIYLITGLRVEVFSRFNGIRYKNIF
jgi:hypothetical protein